MQHVLFELLENAGLLKGSILNIDKIARAKRSELYSIAEQSAELTSTSSIANVGSIFSHTASLSLSGSPTPCSGPECRMKMVRELIQFAAFYSDRVFINNNLSRFAEVYSDSSLDEARYGLCFELEIMAAMRPLIEKGIIVPVTPPLGCVTTAWGKVRCQMESAGDSTERFVDFLRGIPWKLRFHWSVIQTAPLAFTQLGITSWLSTVRPTAILTNSKLSSNWNHNW